MWDSNLYRRDPFKHSGDRNVAVHFPQTLICNDVTMSGVTVYDDQPDWYTATIPALAISTDLTGHQVFRASYASLEFSLIEPPPRSFADWTAQLPPAEKRLVASVSFAVCGAEDTLVQYLQLPCTLYIGTDGGKRHHRGSFSWIICSPGREQLVLNAGPVDGWFKCQSSLCSEVTALSSVTLYLDELAAFHSLDVACTFKMYVDSTSAISNVKLLRDMIPRRTYPDNADVLSTMKSADHIIGQFIFEHVKSHQDATVAFDDLPFSAQLNVLCDAMATAQMQRQLTTASECTQSNPLSPRTMLPVEISYGSQIISSHYVARLRELIGVSSHRVYLQKKYQWSDAIWTSIAWEAFGLSARKSSVPMKNNHSTPVKSPTPILHSFKNRSKLVHNWLNLGRQKERLCSTPHVPLA